MNSEHLVVQITAELVFDQPGSDTMKTPLMEVENVHKYREKRQKEEKRREHLSYMKMSLLLY